MFESDEYITDNALKEAMEAWEDEEQMNSERDAKTKTIHTAALEKKYKLVNDKRVVRGIDTFPYGYCLMISK